MLVSMLGLFPGVFIGLGLLGLAVVLLGYFVLHLLHQERGSLTVHQDPRVGLQLTSRTTLSACR